LIEEDFPSYEGDLPAAKPEQIVRHVETFFNCQLVGAFPPGRRAAVETFHIAAKSQLPDGVFGRVLGRIHGFLSA
jgi:hypothetical protein